MARRTRAAHRRAGLIGHYPAITMSTNEPDGPPSDPWATPPPPPPPPPYGQPPTAPYGQPPTAGYGQPPGAPYGQPAYGGYQPYAAPQTEGSAVGALVASILSFVVCPIIPAIVALVMIPGAKRKIEASGGRLTGDGLLTAAKWVSLANIALWGLMIIGFIVLIIIGAATSGDSTSDFSLGVLSAA